MSDSTRLIKIGAVEIGAGRPIAVQSMTKTDTRDVQSTVRQIRELQDVGCDIVRLSVVDMEAARAFGEIRKAVDAPLVADIHFDYRLALESIRQGADKVRINPGNIGDSERVRQVAEAAGERGIPIRIGVNGGSLERELLVKYGGVTAEALVESAVFQLELLNIFGFYDTVISIKASDVQLTVDACRLFDSKKTGVPQHIGITEAGTPVTGIVKSTVGLYELLREGIGDTIRYSLTGDPIDEVIAARTLLQTLEKDGCSGGVELVSCPTCGRCRVDMVDFVRGIERHIYNIKTNRHIKIAIMGCAVNGPGEARGADIGAAFGDGRAALFKHGKILYHVPMPELAETLLKEIEQLL